VVTLSGPVRPPPSGDALVMAAVPGRIVTLPHREGDPIARGETLAQLDDRTLRDTLRSAEADLASARATLVAAEATEERKRSLLDVGVVSRADADAAHAAAESARATVLANAAKVDAAETDLTRATVPSPISGVVERVLVRVGQSVDTLTPLAEVVDPSRLEIVASVPAAEIARLHVDQPARVHVGKADLEATVTAVAPGVSPDTGLGTVRLVLARGAAPVGALATAEVTVDVRDGALFLPRAAVRDDLGQGHVVVVCDQGTARVVPVTLGDVRPDGLVEIRTGLQPGESVVDDGGLGLRTGDPLTPSADEAP
jgi:RND family efflux transporter MFP subunit